MSRSSQFLQMASAKSETFNSITSQQGVDDEPEHPNEFHDVQEARAETDPSQSKQGFQPQVKEKSFSEISKIFVAKSQEI